MTISTNFPLKDVQYSKTAEKLGIDNTMPSVYYGNAQNIAKYVLEPVRLHFGKPFRPTSWYRSQKLNIAVGGSPTSDHMLGLAADIKITGVSLMALAEYIRDNLDFDQLILEPGWVHVSYRKAENRKQVKTWVGPLKYTPGLQG